MSDLALRGGALLLFIAIMAGGVYAADQAFGTPDAAGPGAVQLTTPEPAKSAAPGTAAAFPLVVRNAGATPAKVHLSATAPGGIAVAFAPNDLELAPGASRGVFATATVPAAQVPGAVRVLVQATLDGKPAGSLPLTLAAAAPAKPAQLGEQVTLDYVGRFPDGAMFDTSVRAIGEGPWDKPANFRRDYQPLRIPLGPEAGTIEGFWRNVQGLGAGQSKSFVLAPEQAYGGEVLRQEVPREQAVPRLSQAFERLQMYPRSVLSNYLNASSQVGDEVRIQDPTGNERLYRVSALDAINATLLWEVRPGDRFTVYPLWPGQSRAHEVTNTTVVFRTTPDDPDQVLTFYNFWPNATRIKTMNETTLLLEHNPPVGLEFAVPQRGPPVTGRVAELTAEAVVVERPNDHPLAGRTLVFDVTVRSVEPAFQAP